MRIELKVNGQSRMMNIDPGDYLSETLRENGYHSVKRGCDTSSCGNCTVLVDGKPVSSCTYLSARADGKSITTVEGIREEATLIAELFGHEGADQCGFCNPSMALTLYAMKKEMPEANDDDIREYLVGNLCRCTGYEGQHRAIKKYLAHEEVKA